MGPEFWAEPANALTSADFFCLWPCEGAIKARRRGITGGSTGRRSGLQGLIGVGSVLFHSFATRGSELADTLPTWAFVGLFIHAAIRRMTGRVTTLALNAIKATIFWFAAQEGGNAAPALLNGSQQYAPAVVALAVFTAVTFARRHPTRLWVAGATAAVALSLMFRSLDLAVCAALPLGVHFLWHLLNALMVGLLLQVVLRSPPPVRAPAPR